ncbi:GGDEF domain-containing protein [Bowmanella sp. JS7-9]|uniref:diguanylate cyclase n=1 Tax=Pseudobowmanella zhangzhouensis TaxID=1537679 RepID=A0ABW1XPB2_9ALTE|nr:GGDEF domain-containing protein [Bowmanella sp. JS7-9]
MRINARVMIAMCIFAFASTGKIATAASAVCGDNLPASFEPYIQQLNTAVAQAPDASNLTDCSIRVTLIPSQDASVIANIPLMVIERGQPISSVDTQPDNEQVLQQVLSQTNFRLVTNMLNWSTMNNRLSDNTRVYLTGESIALYADLTALADMTTRETLANMLRQQPLPVMQKPGSQIRLISTDQFWLSPWFWGMVVITVFLIVGYRYYLLALQSVTLDSKNYELDLKNQELTSLKDRIQKRNQELEYLSTHDSMTGLLNRPFFEQMVEREQNRAYRSGQPLSLLLLDLDHFKQINDNFGHTEGDNVLKETAALLRKHLRSVDLIARWGGEEFTILLPDTPVHIAYELAERLRQHLANLLLPPVGHITCSIGVTGFEAKEKFEKVFLRADRALYQAKETRNAVVASELETI